MAPSLVKKIGAAVACAGAVRAATETYQLSEEYTADNFFDKFDFFVSTYTSDDSWDLTHGFVEYLSQTDAQSLGLISTTSDGQMYIGPDINSTYDADGKGRSSVRMTSKATYNQGLMIAKFSHMPVQACGAWPAFWSYGSPWLTMGEIDYFEGWDLMGYNRMAMHTNETLAGSCLLSESGISGTVLTQQCNNNDTGTGCGVQDDSGVWGSVTGATFAMEWTDSAIKIWSWIPTSVPADVTAGTPDPSSSAWGNPTLLVEQDNCDLSKSFANQQLVFDIDFCGDTAGSSTIWDATCSAFGDSCSAYVAENPLAFAETYFMVEGIQFYEL
ncbi:family 16 glycoside hydrolase, partial [Cryphonectria parasitica EP155]